MYGEEERHIRRISASVLRECGGVFLSFVCREQHLNLPENLSDIAGGMGDFFSKDYLLSPERIRKKDQIVRGYYVRRNQAAAGAATGN